MSSTITPRFPFFYSTCIYSTDHYILLCSSQWIAAALSASLWEIVRPVNIHLIDENVFCHGVMNEVKWRMMSGSLQHVGDVVQVVTKLWRPQHFIKWHTASYTTPWKYCSTLFFFPIKFSVCTIYHWLHYTDPPWNQNPSSLFRGKQFHRCHKNMYWCFFHYIKGSFDYKNYLIT